MKRFLALPCALLLLLLVAVPALAADPADLPHTGRVLFAVGGDLNLPAGDQADAVIVFNGTATVAGTANVVIVIDGTAALNGAVAEDVVVVRGSVELGTGTRVLNDVRTLDASVSRAADVAVGGRVAGLEADLAGWALFLGAAAILLWIGLGVATLLAALLLAGLAAKQVRAAGALISHEAGKTILAGFLTLIGPPIVAIALMLTVIGIPAGIGLLIVIWPAIAFIGYLVAAIWLGEWLLYRSVDESEKPRRPYKAAAVGVVVVTVAGIIPLVTFVVSVFGMGAVLLAIWRTFRTADAPEPALRQSAAPMPG